MVNLMIVATGGIRRYAEMNTDAETYLAVLALVFALALTVVYLLRAVK